VHGTCPGLPVRREKFIVDTDISNVGFGGVLSQVKDGNKLIVTYFKKTLSKTEGNYLLTRRELLSIMKTPEQFHKYLYRQESHLGTDHSAFTGC
jgi:hypothetical protein